MLPETIFFDTYRLMEKEQTKSGLDRARLARFRARKKRVELSLSPEQEAAVMSRARAGESVAAVLRRWINEAQEK